MQSQPSCAQRVLRMQPNKTKKCRKKSLVLAQVNCRCYAGQLLPQLPRPITKAKPAQIQRRPAAELAAAGASRNKLFVGAGLADVWRAASWPGTGAQHPATHAIYLGSGHGGPGHADLELVKVVLRGDQQLARGAPAAWS